MCNNSFDFKDSCGPIFYFDEPNNQICFVVRLTIQNLLN